MNAPPSELSEPIGVTVAPGLDVDLFGGSARRSVALLKDAETFQQGTLKARRVDYLLTARRVLWLPTGGQHVSP